MTDESTLARLNKVNDEDIQIENNLEKLEKFMADTKVDRIAVNTSSGSCFLSNAEVKCLIKQCQDYILNDITKELGHSSKEVERHLSGIKNKTGYSSQEDLAKLFKDIMVHNSDIRSSVI